LFGKRNEAEHLPLWDIYSLHFFYLHKILANEAITLMGKLF